MKNLKEISIRSNYSENGDFNIFVVATSKKNQEFGGSAKLSFEDAQKRSTITKAFNKALRDAFKLMNTSTYHNVISKVEEEAPLSV